MKNSYQNVESKSTMKQRPAAPPLIAGRIGVNSDKQHLTDAIGNLPDIILSALKEAVELSDSAMIEEVIEKIRIKDTTLARALSKLAGNFAYDMILDLFPKPRQ